MEWLAVFYLFIFIYPAVMALIWIGGGIYYYFHWERAQLKIARQGLLPLDEYPKVSIMVPCYNEGANVNETINYLLKQNYPNFEIIAINDGSKDDTATRLNNIAEHEPRLIVVHQKNQGKAAALNNGTQYSTSDILVCIDGDALLDLNALRWMVKHFQDSPKVGAVTGNPRVRTRTTIIGKIQTGEFSSIIGLIKRAQRIYGTIYTVSGVVCAFRKSAIMDIGGWSTDMITEDIDVSWKLQINDWQIRYEPQARCWVLMPETLRGLYMQRLRWAQGGAEVFFKQGMNVIVKGKTKLWPLMLEYLMSVFWCYSLAYLMLAYFIQLFTLSEQPTTYQLVTFEWSGFVLVLICLMQFTVSLMIDRHYDVMLRRNFLWCIWYPMFYWFLNVITVTIAVPKALIRKKGEKAIWESPDRGEVFRDND
ncbi:poly-beta-1,6-N-acetyl-D-glucosamine synthase [Photobacterium profundum]|uniref:Poly-beta-1,6-N-acetyl-D-glucosamine synthase n=1 Tax=Photobacterium profundum (strain SS9) TaxID=298386 RepID=Q6LK51_PHOPR|nr:poly-beta-1,6-N-acetyl-D-glucosamine synthase [Photobacterium profundum]CAG22329.1 Putative glycosyl transferase [Photobacterium profundum SS9]